MKIIFSLLLTLLAHNMQAQIVLKGKLLLAEDETAVSGATVFLQNSNSKTITGAGGLFSITLTAATDTLIITHTSYIPVKLVVNSNTKLPLLIRIRQLAKQLDEVLINTGYQSLPKERATGSFEKISNELFNQQTATTVLGRLEAIAGSVYIDNKGGGGILTIRGLSTIQGPKSPLIILDDFPYEGNLANINPNDVENITILKDAAAASIWGTKAGNGVIVITTKKGKFNQPVKVEINNNISITQKPNLFYMKNISSSDFIDVEQFLYSKGYYTGMLNSNSKPPVSPVIELLVKKANGSISPAEADARINALRSHDVRNDFDKYMYQTAVNRQHAIGIRGGSNTVAWNFSAGLDQNSSALAQQYNRVNLRTYNIFKLSKNIQLTAALFYTQAKNSSGRPGYNDITAINGKIPPYSMLANASGDPLPVIKDYRQAYLDTAGAGKLLNWNYYPLDDYKQVNHTQIISETTASLGLNIKLIKGLTADIKYQYQRQSVSGRTLYNQESYYTRNLINLYSQLNRTTGVVTYRIPKGAILNNTNEWMLAHNIRGQLSFSRRFKLIEINAIAGTEIRQVNTTGNSFRTYGYNDDILTHATVDYATPAVSFITGSSSFLSNGVDFSDQLNRFVSFYGNASFSYKDRYTISGSFRRDASNLFGINTNDKWTPLWSAGMAWDISKEKNYRFNALPYLRVRLTYGVSGNADPDRSAVTTIMYLSVSPYTQLPVASINQFSNPGLRWEKVYMLNTAIDFKTKNNRLSGSVEYYRKKAVDLFGPNPVDYTAVATNSIVQNIASIRATGIDIQLNSINLKQGPLKWSTNFNISFNKDVVLKYYRSNMQGSNIVGGGTGVSAIAGKPVYALYAYRWAGLDPLTGDPQGYFNGQVSKDYSALTGSSTLVSDLVYIGPARPRVFGSMGNTVSWKNLSLTARLTYKFGYYIKYSSINYNLLYANRNGHPDYAKHWQKPGDEQFTNVPSIIYPAVSSRDNFYNNAEILTGKGDHLRLQYITLSYTLNKGRYLGMILPALQFYVNVNNLGIIWRANNRGIDPDYSETSLLPSKNYAIGLKADF